MDTYENEEMLEETVAQPQQEQPEEPVSEGFYAGMGAGMTEEIGNGAETQPLVDENAQPEAEMQPEVDTVPPEKPAKPKRKFWKKLLACAAVAVFIVVAVASGIVVGSGLTKIDLKAKYEYILEQNENMQLSLSNQLDVLRAELENYKNSNTVIVTDTQDALTPSQVYEKNIASVVAINCVTAATSGNQVYQSTSAGSGFVLSEDGYIVTNHHVIDGADTITVVFADGTQMDATLIGSDSNNDIALIKVEATGLQAVTLGSSDALCVGEQVVAIGNALGELSFSLTSGYVSGIDRSVTTDSYVLSMIQTDAAINSGNSGGPLFNSRGEVVGIISAKYSGTTTSGASIEGIGFAIPIDDVIDMLNDLREYGYVRSSYLGITAYNVDSSVAEAYSIPLGVVVNSVVSGGAADKAGLKAKDIIVEIGGFTIENMTDLTRALYRLSPGETTSITVWRGGETVYLTITLDEKPQS